MVVNTNQNNRQTIDKDEHMFLNTTQVSATQMYFTVFKALWTLCLKTKQYNDNGGIIWNICTCLNVLRHDGRTPDVCDWDCKVFLHNSMIGLENSQDQRKPLNIEAAFPQSM